MPGMGLPEKTYLEKGNSPTGICRGVVRVQFFPSTPAVPMTDAILDGASNGTFRSGGGMGCRGNQRCGLTNLHWESMTQPQRGMAKRTES